MLLFLSAPPLHRRMVEGSNNRFLRTPADGIPPSSRHPGPWSTGGPLHAISRCPTSTGAVHKSMIFRCVFMLVQLNKWAVVCGSDMQRGHSGDGCLSSLILFKYECSMERVCSELGQSTTGCYGKCCFGVMYCEWYGVCDFVVLSVVEVCADYGGVNVFHVCLYFGVVYSVGVCVNVCVVVCCLFLTSGCCLLCCNVV